MPIPNPHCAGSILLHRLSIATAMIAMMQNVKPSAPPPAARERLRGADDERERDGLGAPCEPESLAEARAAMRSRNDAEFDAVSGPVTRDRTGHSTRARTEAGRVVPPAERPRDREGDGLDDTGKLLGSFTACVP